MGQAKLLWGLERFSAMGLLQAVIVWGAQTLGYSSADRVEGKSIKENEVRHLGIRAQKKRGGNKNGAHGKQLCVLSKDPSTITEGNQKRKKVRELRNSQENTGQVSCRKTQPMTTARYFLLEKFWGDKWPSRGAKGVKKRRGSQRPRKQVHGAKCRGKNKWGG